MKRHEREALAIIQGLVRPWGLPCRPQIGGKHMAVVVTTRDGCEHKFPLSGSPKNVDHMLGNVRQQVMAWMEQHGMATGRGRSGDRKPKRHTRNRSRIWRVVVAVDPDDGPARDPWAALSGFRVNG